MNKIAIPGSVWLASDLHLGADTPATSEAFLAFLDAAENEAAALLFPGDIFDAWIGDDVIGVAPPWLVTVMQAIKRTALRIPVWLDRGNRDFLMGEELATALGVHLLPESALIDTDFGLIAVTHGDEFCTDDQAYQQFRSMVRNPQWQAQFLAKTIPERLVMAQQARDESQAANQMKSNDIMDVSPSAVEAFFQHSKAPILVHGHTHRPARHVLTIDGRKYERWVLPDWDCDHAKPLRGGWLIIDQDGLHNVDLSIDE